MRNVHPISIVIFAAWVSIFVLAGCADTTSTSFSDQARAIDTADSEVIFVGEEYPDVHFQHKDHSDRFGDNCFECHNCGDVVGDIYWNCRDCHSPSDPEQLCDEDQYHGCTFAQCDYCHEDQELNPGLTCEACHTPLP